MYQFKEYVKRDNQFFVFDKMMVRKKIWANLLPASKSIYPVIASHCDAKGHAYPTEATIAAIAGCDLKTVRKGIEGLLGFPGFRVENTVSNHGMPRKKYNLEPAPYKKGKTFPFFRSVFDGGNWSEASQSAQALYPVMMTFAMTDADLYAKLEGLEDVGYNNFFDNNAHGDDGYYRERRYDFCAAPLEVIGEYTGIGDRRTVKKALANLEETELVAYAGEVVMSEETNWEPSPTWKVYRHPFRTYNLDYLNGKIAKKLKAYEEHKQKYLNLYRKNNSDAKIYKDSANSPRKECCYV